MRSARGERVALRNIEGFRPIRASKGKSQRTDAMDKEPSGAGPPGSKSGPGAWQAMLPPAHWLRLYRPQWLARDAIAGVTLAPYGIPVSLAYASLAGLPPQYGVYCNVVGGPLFALFGSSRQLAVGPTSAISLLVGVSVAGMAAGDPGRWASIATLTAVLMAGMCNASLS
jgi:hypothetical protein